MFVRITLFLICLTCIPAPARAISIEEIIALTQAGLSDVVLIALIDADQTKFMLDAKQVLALREAGVSETVLLKMIQSRQQVEAAAADYSSAPDRVPSLMIAGVASPSWRSLEVTTIVVPYYIPVAVWPSQLLSSRADGVAARLAGGFGIANPAIRTDEHEGARIRGPLATARQPRGFGRFINDATPAIDTRPSARPLVPERTAR